MDESIKLSPIGDEYEIFVSRHHTFGTDAIVLASFANPRKTDKAVDLGTGCGIIPLIMLRNGMLSEVTGVEISEEATALCEKTKKEPQKAAHKTVFAYFSVRLCIFYQPLWQRTADLTTNRRMV